MGKLEIRVPHVYQNEISISREIAKEILIDTDVNVNDFDWFVCSKSYRPLELYDILEEHETYDLLGYRTGD